MEEELQKVLTEEPDKPAETASTETPPAPAPAPEEAAPPPEFNPPSAPPMDNSQYLAALAQQQAYQTQLLAQQMQQMNQQLKPPEKEEALPDPTLEPEKYIQRAVKQQLDQITPMLQQSQMQTAVNTALINREAVKQQLGPEFARYEGVINELASRFPPTAFGTPDAWKALFFMAKGADNPAPPAASTASAPSPQAAQGQWPGAKAPPPPVSSPGRAAPQSNKKPKTYSAEHLKIAEGLGLKPEDLDAEEA